MSVNLEQLVDRAKAAGVLPATATLIAHDNRPWPVVLLTGLGAWLAAVPLFGVVMLLFGSLLQQSGSLYLVGSLTLLASVVTLRSRGVHLFVEQLVVPALIVASISLGTALFQDLEEQFASMALAILALAVAIAVPQAWLRILLGSVAGAFITSSFMDDNWLHGSRTPLFTWMVGTYASLFLWAGACSVLARGKAGRHGAALEAIISGWAITIMLGAALWAGLNLMDPNAVPTPDGGNGTFLLSQFAALQAGSLLLAAGAAAWLAWRWPGMRKAWLAGVAVVLIALSWMMPSLGVVLLVIAVCAASGRSLLACAGAVAVAWIVGAFYYQLSFSLGTKAVILVNAGLLLGAMGWLGTTAATVRASVEGTLVPAGGHRIRLGILAALIGVLGVANTGIWRNENLIATGQPVFVALAPVDPRSLMQGDYMRLNFDLPAAEEQFDLARGKRPHVVAKADARGVATMLRMHRAEPLAPGEFLIELTPKDGRWTLVTDAWFFEEGDAQRWGRAKYGEFRVNPDGRALLVDLRGAELQKL